MFVLFQSEHWPVLRRSSSTVAMSHLEATRAQEQQEEEEFGSAPVNAMALLNVNHGSQPMAVAETYVLLKLIYTSSFVPSNSCLVICDQLPLLLHLDING